MMKTRNLAARLRKRHQLAAFESALRTASPAMHQELLAAATRTSGYNR